MKARDHPVCSFPSGTFTSVLTFVSYKVVVTAAFSQEVSWVEGWTTRHLRHCFAFWSSLAALFAADLYEGKGCTPSVVHDSLQSRLHWVLFFHQP